MQVTSRNLSTLPDGMHRLERGVYLKVQGKTRAFVFRYLFNGKRRDIGLGGVNQTLTAVRAKATKLRSLLAAGVDPREQKDAERAEQQAITAEADTLRRIPTFGQFYKDAIKHLAYVRQWRGVFTERGWWQQTEDYLIPTLKNIRLDDITPAMIAKTLQPIWGQEKGRRTLEKLHGLLGYAKTLGYVDKNCAEWAGGLDGLLPARSAMRRGEAEKHHAAVPASELRDVVKVLRDTANIGAKCALFGILTVCRNSEFRLAEWGEFNFDEKTFSVPPCRRKDGKPEPHIVPLSTQAVDLIKSLPWLCDAVFTAYPPRPLCGAATLDSVKRACDKPITMHGVRSSFSDWCARNDKNFLVSEKCLMHSVGGKVFMAYQRDDLLDQRRVLLQEWADYLYGQ